MEILKSFSKPSILLVVEKHTKTWISARNKALNGTKDMSRSIYLLILYKLYWWPFSLFPEATTNYADPDAVNCIGRQWWMQAAGGCDKHSGAGLRQGNGLWPVITIRKLMEIQPRNMQGKNNWLAEFSVTVHCYSSQIADNLWWITRNINRKFCKLEWPNIWYLKTQHFN